MSKLLTKKDFLKKRPLKQTTVEVPEWGGHVIVQEMTALTRDRFEEWVLSKGENNQNDAKGTRVQIIIATVVDENGKPLFSDLDAPDLASKSGNIIDRISSEGLKLSGMSEAVLEEETKNSETVSKEDSASDSVES